MKALVKTKKAPGHMQLAEVPEPMPDAHEVKVEIQYCGICGTDIKIRHDKHAYYGPPLILGHEYSSVVVEVGGEVSGVSVGDEVVVAPSPTSNVSLRGRSRNPWGNAGAGFESEWGFTRYGAFARYFVCDARRVLKLPDNVDLESAALTEPVSVCLRGVQDKAQVLSSDVVVVSGPGTIGLLTAQLVKAQGGFVVVLGISSDVHRLELAKELGADMVINIDEQDPLPEILSLTHGAGVDQVFECAGVEASVKMCIELARRGGHYVQLGTSMQVMEIDFMQIAYKELTVAGSFAFSRTGWERSLGLLSRGLIQTAPLVSHKLPLSDWENAFALAEGKSGVKVLLYPD
ncbi:MAG: zinc-binding dehydrogenase [Candidatus Latescibacteria bacterium]|nr:zinc-binding dehydrogenase [Candidatus Latescibacterota bacterium]